MTHCHCTLLPWHNNTTAASTFFFTLSINPTPKLKKSNSPTFSKHCTHKEQTAAPLETSAEAPSQAGKRVERCGRFAHAGPQRVQQVLPPHVLLRRAAHRELARLGQDFHGADQRPLLLRYPGRASTASHRFLDSAPGGREFAPETRNICIVLPEEQTMGIWNAHMSCFLPLFLGVDAFCEQRLLSCMSTFLPFCPL